MWPPRPLDKCPKVMQIAFNHRVPKAKDGLLPFSGGKGWRSDYRPSGSAVLFSQPFLPSSAFPIDTDS
jgi:hypothetical protein